MLSGFIYSLVRCMETQTTQFEKRFKVKEDEKDVEYILEYKVNERNEVKHVRITKILYPLECCLNNVKNVKTVIEIGKGKTEPYRVEVYMVTDSWNDIERDDIFIIEFNDYGYELPPFLSLDTLEIINSIYLLKEFIKDIIEYIVYVYMLSIDSFIE